MGQRRQTLELEVLAETRKRMLVVPSFLGTQTTYPKLDVMWGVGKACRGGPGSFQKNAPELPDTNPIGEGVPLLDLPVDTQLQVGQGGLLEAQQAKYHPHYSARMYRLSDGTW